jgi:hypothetical protein
MISIDKTIISEDVIKVQFVCDLKSCHGDCCVEGDEGAPLEEEEIGIIEDALDEIVPYMTPEGITVIDKSGVFDYGMDGDYVTPLINGKECAFVYQENGVWFCAIEKAYREGKIDFIKPISCHLYPIRITEYADFDAINYHKWPICSSAIEYGKELGIPVYKMLKEPLIRKYGENWYQKLEEEIDSGIYDEVLKR